ncbi:DUF3568 family protein [Desulfovibrio oxyclinae]|jgi:uncharacterized protein YceK|uniref:DUF3568 family protein n=1 Tax=Desulfovibrio oxyclinae TaxID=63560 RepID=UPI00035D7CE8|nr:DUF3568 family protein [Desulfovibrio oxyclinae]
MRIKNLVLAMMLLLSAVAVTGCGAIIAGTAAATGTYVYVDGQAKADYRASLGRTYDASLAACRSLGMNITGQEIDGDSASISADYRGDTIWIRLSLEGDNFTQVSVRVGLLGDKVQSRRIHDSIAANL